MSDENAQSTTGKQPFDLGKIIDKIHECQVDIESSSFPPVPGSKLDVVAQKSSIKGLSLPRVLGTSAYRGVNGLRSIISMLLGPGSADIPSMYTALRMPLLCAAKVLWVLLPDDLDLCVERAQRLIKDEYTQFYVTLKHTSDFKLIRGVSVDHKVRQELEEIRRAQEKSVKKISSSAIIREYAHDVEAYAGKDPEKGPEFTSEHTVFLWNLASAYSHGQGWTSLISNSTQEMFDEYTTSLETVALHYLLASFKLMQFSTDQWET